jgi:holo-[acyl-carrier protein] synthase
MILGVGLDIVKMSRISRLYKKYGNKFYERVFTEQEIEKSKVFSSEARIESFFAKRFAAKEAFVKAIGCGIGKNIAFLDVEVVSDINNKPQINLTKKANEYIKKRFNNANIVVHLSLSDEKDLASAMVVIEEVKE